MNDSLEDLLRQGHTDAARELANQLLESSDDPAVHLAAHQAHARAAMAGGDPEFAEVALDNALALDPGHPLTRALAAHLALDQGNSERALTHLKQGRERAGNRDPDPSFHHALARLAYAFGDVGTAVGELEKACRLDPDNRALPIVWAALLAEAGEVERACEVLGAHCHRFPDEAVAWRLASDLLWEHSGPREALAWLLLGVEHCPEDPGLQLQALGAATACGDLAIGLELAGRVQLLAPQDAAVLLGVGRFYLIAGDPVRARQNLRKATKLDPDQPGLRRFRAMALVLEAGFLAESDLAGRAALRQEARGILDEQLASQPEDLDAAIDLSALLLAGRAADRGRATALLDQVLTRRPDDATALVNRAALHLSAGEKKKAGKLARRATALASTGSVVERQARDLLEQLNTSS